MSDTIKKLSPFRLLSSYAYEALGTGHNMYAQIELDVTDILQELRLLRRGGHNVSFFSFILSSIAKAIDENRELNSICCGKQVYYFDEVDISTAIELMTDGTPIPHLYVVRNAAKKTAEEITAEIENAKKKWKETGSAGKDDDWELNSFRKLAKLPKWFVKLLLTKAIKNPYKIKERFGTTYLASVSGYSDIGGFIIPYFEGQYRPLSFALGSVVKKPGIINSEIKVRDYLSMTIAMNHDLIDGAPAARFINKLRHRIEGSYIS